MHELLLQIVLSILLDGGASPAQLIALPIEFKHSHRGQQGAGKKKISHPDNNYFEDGPIDQIVAKALGFLERIKHQHRITYFLNI